MEKKKWQHKVERCVPDRNSEVNDIGEVVGELSKNFRVHHAPGF